MFLIISKKQFLWYSFLLVFLCGIMNAAPGKITGRVVDKINKQSLPGTNVIVLKTTMGAAADMDGYYSIVNIPPGSYKLKISYIGYKTQEIDIQVRDGVHIEQNFELEPEGIEGQTVIITAQREGQIAAINQQISSDAIKNIVSADKIQELPEANAAEAVGRLPGISLQREGGEGNKVVIRGLAPKYNRIQIDGVNMAATDEDDRSTDLSMISPYLLGGIEVTKSAMADQEADQLGGTVNFITKGAPYSEPSYKLIMEGGYNGLRSNYNDYRIAAQTSRREFDDLLGISVNLDVEKVNRSSNTVGAGYYFLQEDNMAVVNSLNIEDISRDLNRYGGSLLLDFKTASTNIMLSNMVSRIERTTVSRNESSSGLFSGSSSRNQRLNFAESNTTILMNQLRIEQNLGSLNIDAGVSYSYSNNKSPEELGYGGTEPTPLSRPVLKTSSPVQIPGFMKNDTSAIMLGEITDSETFTKEDEFGSHVNLEWRYNLSDLVSIKLKGGGKYKHKSRSYDFNTLYLNIYRDPSGIVNNAIIKKWPWMANYYTTGKFPYEPFIDTEYNPGDFLAGEYKIERIPSLNMGKELIYYLQEYLGVDWQGATVPQKFTPNFHSSKMSDYYGTEDYLAFYILPTISIGEQVTIIPGLRYEKNETNYNGIRGNANLQVTESRGYIYHDTTVTRKDEFFLPMIHARYKPSDWFDIRASYTQTLSRPSYTEFIPSWHIYMTGIDYRNPDLKSAKSENYDLYFSLYGNKIGLLTVGLFAKRIDDLIFSQSEIITSDTMAVEKFGLYERLTGQAPTRFVSKPIWSFINNPNKVKVSGIEIEWQSNLWYLPGLLQNIVFSINYTYTFSEVKYPRTVPIKKIVSSPFGNREVIVGNADSSYTAPLLYQPDHILNITLGYDYEGFSIRGSMQFKSRIFSENNWRPQLRGYTDDFYLFDLAVSQKLPIEGLVLFGNLKNISKTIESDYNQGTGYMSNKEYYGMTGNFGIKYHF